MLGPFELNFRRRRNQDGVTVWRQVKQRVVWLPTNVDEMPDLFVYLYRGKNFERVCYHRMNALALLQKVLQQGCVAPAAVCSHLSLCMCLMTPGLS